MTTKDDGNMRSFETGATRDTGEGKLDYEGFLSPGVLEQFAKFMNMNRLQSDGNLRDSDNWQKGIPMDVYRKSLMRHYMEFWIECRHRESFEYTRQSDIHLMAAACGMLFNIMGYMHEWQKKYVMVEFDTDEPTTEMAARIAKIQEDKRQAIKQEAKEGYTKAFEEYCNNWGDRLEIVNDINETPADQPCECSPGDCDCGYTGRIYGFAMPTDLYVDGDREDDWKITTEAPRYCTESLLDVEDGWDCDCDLCLAENGDEGAKERLKEDVQPGEVPLPDWVPSEKPTTFPTLKDAMGALFKYVGDDNIANILVETNEVDRTCDDCRFFSLAYDEHPCDCCDDDYSNFSRK
jgi:hypothetical protein